MKKSRSKLFKNIKGPNIKASFYINEKGVDKVELSPNDRGFEWEVVGNQMNELLPSLTEWIEMYCKKKHPKITFSLDLIDLPPYTTQVLTILRKIPFGLSLSYAELAELTGNPKGARAVGNACALNPIPLLIPCHRVLAKGNHLGGFSMGLEIKKRLLEFEKIPYIE